MDELLDLLRELDPEVDFENEEALIDDRILDSLTILALIADIEETFDVTVPAVEIVPANFNSAKAMYEMIERLQEEG
ncbi:MAG: acyl carrier protein [Clostridia bacterium]|nr:acyl carrier protein [Clostridia bacterium]